jgi:hypothetical protein
VDVTTANGAYDNPARPETLPLHATQPTLRLILIAHHPTPRGTVTAIVRSQDPAGVPLCQLCPKAECATAADGTCLVMADGYVAEATAASYARPGSVVASRTSRAFRSGSGRVARR